MVLSARAQTTLSSIDLARLIQTFMLPKGVNYNVLEWSTGSTSGTPISWQHAGIKDCAPFILDREIAQPFCRSGTVVITSAGKPTHTTLGRVLEPGRWNIILAGGRAGVSYIVLDSNVLSPELSSDLLRSAASKAGTILQLRRLSVCGNSSGGSEQFNISASGRESAIIREWWTCGSAGCNVKLTIAPAKEDGASLMRCAS